MDQCAESDDGGLKERTTSPPHVQFNLGECAVDDGERSFLGMTMSCFASWKTSVMNQTMYVMKGDEEERWDSIGRVETRSNVFRCFKMGTSKNGEEMYISQGVKNTCLGNDGQSLSLRGHALRDMDGSVQPFGVDKPYEAGSMAKSRPFEKIWSTQEEEGKEVRIVFNLAKVGDDKEFFLVRVSNETLSNTYFLSEIFTNDECGFTGKLLTKSGCDPFALCIKFVYLEDAKSRVQITGPGLVNSRLNICADPSPSGDCSRGVLFPEDRGGHAPGGSREEDCPAPKNL